MGKHLLVELRPSISTWLESESSRLRPVAGRRVTKREVLEASLLHLSGLPEGDRTKVILAGGLAWSAPADPAVAVARRVIEERREARVDERLLTVAEITAALGVGPAVVAGVKRAMGIRRKKLFLAEVRDFLKENPAWNSKAAEVLPAHR